jgi:hypothetical protein
MSLLSFGILSFFVTIRRPSTFSPVGTPRRRSGYSSISNLVAPHAQCAGFGLAPAIAAIAGVAPDGACVFATHLGAYGWTWQTRQVAPIETVVSLALQIAIGVACYVLFAWPDCRWLWMQLAVT